MSVQIERAKIEAERARKRLGSTMGALQQRLKPGALADQAWSGVKDRGGEIADEAMDAVKARPAATAGVIAAFLLFLARRPIVSGASRLWNRNQSDGVENRGVTNGGAENGMAGGTNGHPNTSSVEE